MVQVYPDAQVNLGVMYANGQGVPQDYAEAVKWWRKAAEQNHESSQVCLGLCYADGKGVEKDFVEAVKWYREAAEQNGSVWAHYELGHCYENGHGVPLDFIEAYKFYKLAGSRKNAGENLKHVMTRMTAVEIAEGERRSSEE